MAEFGPPRTVGDVVGDFSRIEVDLLGFDEASVALADLSLYLENVQLPLRAAARIGREDMAKRFQTETDPDGNQWIPLDPDYAKRKQHDVGFDHPILTRSSDLKTAATSQGAWTVAGDSLFFSTADLPEYWHVHQEGSPDFGVAFHKGEYESLAIPGQKTESPAQKEYFKRPGPDHQQNIPPRPYIGLSAEAEGEILDLFDVWFSYGVEEASRKYLVSPSGVLHERAGGGRIGPKVIL